MSTTFVRGENPLRADKLNTAFSERVDRSGDTMTGMLMLAGDPVGNFDAATKQYVDTKISSLTNGYLPIVGGTLTGGLSFGAAVDTSISDTARHITLHNAGYGLGITTSRLNLVSPANSLIQHVVGGAARFTVGTGSASLLVPFSRTNASYDLMTAPNVKGDGVTDDTVAIQNFLNGLPRGAEVILPAGSQFLIDSADLAIPYGITVRGQGAMEGGSILAGPAFILNPARRIFPYSGVSLSNFKILRKGLLASPTTAQSNAAVDAWMAEAFLRKTSASTPSGNTLPFTDTTGITVGMRACCTELAFNTTVTAVNPGVSVTFSGTPVGPYPIAAGTYVRFGDSAALDIQATNGMGGISLDHLFIVGFNTAIITECGRIFADDIHADCITALYAAHGGDASYIRHIHCTMIYGGDWTRRSGPLVLMTKADGWHLESCTAVGWANGFVLCGVGGVTLSRCWMETLDDNVTIATGFKTEGHIGNECTLIGCIGGGSVHFDFQHYGGFVSLIGCTSAEGSVTPTTICHYRLGPGSFGQIIGSTLVAGSVTPILVQPGVGRWRIAQLQMTATVPNPWISGAAADLARITIDGAWSVDGTSDNQVQTHLLEKVWISYNTSTASVDGSPQSALAVETLAAGTSDAHLQSFYRNGTRLGYLTTANTNGALQLRGDGKDLSFFGNTKVEILSPATMVGASFGSTIASATNDLSKHIALFGAAYGISITTSRLNLVTGGAVAVAVGGTDVMQFNNTGISLLNAGANVVNFNAIGVGAPAFTTRSAGTKLVLYNAIGASSGDIGIGVEAGYLWFSGRTSSDGFRWYAGTTQTMQLTGAGDLTTIGGHVLGPSAVTIRSGTGAASGTQPKGSMWMRTDGAVGSTLYVSQGGGTWNAVAGV